jgi:hypothetical protein
VRRLAELWALTGQQAADAFLLGVIASAAAGFVAGFIAFLKWLGRISRKFDEVNDKIDARVEEANARWREANLRLANLEKGYVETGEDSLRDSVNRTEHRIARMSRTLGLDGNNEGDK